jgi:effector-binding domain-containing protein
MKVLKWIFIVMLVLIGAFVAGGFVLPDTTHVERSTVIDAKPATVFTVLNGYRQFNRWSPWADLDPKTQYTWSGPLTGVGAKESWVSQDPNVGTGSQEILESVPYSHLRVRLVFGDFTSDNFATYTLTPEGAGTRVVWGYDAEFHGNIVYRYFGAIMDKMLGGDYEKGLARLKAFVETLPKDDFSDLQVEVVEVKPQPIAFASGEAAAADAGPVLAALYGKIGAFMTGASLKQAGAPMAITRDFNDETRFWKFDAAIPVDQACTSTPESEVKCTNTYAGTALRAIHKGPYASMATTYGKLMAFKAVAGFKDNGNSWEHYVSDPGSTPEADLVTHIYWPIQ